MVIALAISVTGAFAGERCGSAPCAPADDPTFGSETVLTLFPAGDIYPVYVADPHRPSNAMLFRFYTQKDIPGTTRRRTGLSAGGRFGLIRIDTHGPQQWSWQVSMDAGLDALFDSDYSNGAIGWDGNYGFVVTMKSAGPWSVKVGATHVSSHVGDEYEDRMHRTRIDYTREEIVAGVAWRPSARWRVYGETGRSYQLLNAQQRPWRAQQGVEYETRLRLWGSRFAWYGAADLQAMQERGWRIDPALEGGIVTRSSGRTYRILIQYANGRPPVTEFFKSSEHSITVGWRVEL